MTITVEHYVQKASIDRQVLVFEQKFVELSFRQHIAALDCLTVFQFLTSLVGIVNLESQAHALESENKLDSVCVRQRLRQTKQVSGSEE